MQSVVEWCRSNALQAVLLIVGMVMFLVGAVQWLSESSKGEEVEFSLPHEAVENNHHKAKLIIDVSGAVSKPGVYSVDNRGRVGEVIEMAGGFADDVNIEWVAQRLNLAQPVQDGQKIYVPARGETGDHNNGGSAGMEDSSDMRVINVTRQTKALWSSCGG